MAEKTAPSQMGTQEATKQITVLDKCATFTESDGIARTHNGELPALKDFIFALKDPKKMKELLSELSRDNWLKDNEGYFETRAYYWTSDKDLKVSGLCRINYEKGSLEKISEREGYTLPPSQKAYVDEMAFSAYKGHSHIKVYISGYRSERALTITATDAKNYADATYSVGRVSFVPTTEAEEKGK